MQQTGAINQPPPVDPLFEPDASDEPNQQEASNCADVGAAATVLNGSAGRKDAVNNTNAANELDLVKASRPGRPVGGAGADLCHSLNSGNSQDDYPIPRAPFVFATQQGRHTHLNVTIAATTLAGLDDLPGELDGHGPISADLCRALAVSAASITAVAVDSSCGTALDVGRTTYRPRLSHRDHVVQRDRTCRFPGCRQPARRCQIDHSEEFCSGGATCPCNLSCLCKFHHDLKTTGLWDAQQHPDASIVWTSPTGRTYRTQTPEWPVAAPKHQPDQSTSTVDDAESSGTADTRTRCGTKPTDTDEPPF